MLPVEAAEAAEAARVLPVRVYVHGHGQEERLLRPRLPSDCDDVTMESTSSHRHIVNQRDDMLVQPAGFDLSIWWSAQHHLTS